MKKVFLVAALLLLPDYGNACSSLKRHGSGHGEHEQCSANHPCEDHNDMVKYNSVKKKCIEDALEGTGKRYVDFIQHPPEDDEIMEGCNEQAFDKSKLEE